MPDSELGKSRPLAHEASLILDGADPLLRAIRAYRAGLADFQGNAPDDDDAANAYADKTYCPPMLELECWRSPAETKESAVAALELARDAHNEGDRSLVGPMISAALLYFGAAS